MSTNRPSVHLDSPAQLSIRKGSKAGPLALLVVTIFLFVLYALPTGMGQLATGLGLSDGPDKLPKLTEIERILSSDAEPYKTKRESLRQRVSSFGVWQSVTQIGLPLVKVYLDQLAKDFGDIARSSVRTVGVLGLFSLIPGIAGLIYRRNFLIWFLASFAILLGINASGVFGSIAGAAPMPGSGAIFYFLLSQVFLLVLAYRLRRHSQGSSLLPSRLHNWGLTALLVFIGVACWQGWGPGYRVVTKAAGQAATVGTSTAPAATPAGVPAAVGASTPDGVTRDAATPGATAGAETPGVPAATTGAVRSWIWGFLGSGLTGWIYKWEFILIGLPLIYTLLRNSGAWTAKARKNIVICLDGTSNTPDQMEMGFLAQTNVYKLFRAVKADKRGMFVPIGQFDASLCKTYGGKQISLYYAGVGNKYDSDPVLQTLGMATGMGAGDIVERAYLDLVRVYKPGDRVFIFGFSRGAAISRLLARTIDARGAPRSVWTLRLFGKHRTIWSSRRRNRVAIDVLGCWDTVGSFGVAKTIAGINFQQLNMFKDLTVPDNVAQAYHMVALDEQRAEFEPTLMDPDPIRPERIVEVWFSGDHANIGGGWATDKLSDVTLDFLLRRISSGYAPSLPDRGGAAAGNEAVGSEAVGSGAVGSEDWGIYLSAKKVRKDDPAADDYEGGVLLVDPDPLGQVRSWFSNLYNYRPRRLPLHAVISDTVFERMTQSMPVYAPQSLFELNDALDAKRDHIEAKVDKLTETNSLTDDERRQVLEFKSRLRLSRFKDYWSALVAARAPQSSARVLSNETVAAAAKA